MSKTGYFVVEHSIDDVNIWFLEQNEKNEEMMNNLIESFVNDEEKVEMWYNFLMESEDNGEPIESWYMGDEWPFEGYIIIDAVAVQQM